MNKYKKPLLIATSFCLVILCGGAALDAIEQKYKLRAYISTRLAKTIITEDYIIPVDNISEECDGSGFITHGDGHRTPCPGCKACKKPDTQMQQTADLPKPKYYLYHFGADWCVPCEKMKKETWNSQAVKDYLEKNNINLLFLDDAKDSKELFKYYDIKMYPTIILLDKNDLTKPIFKSVGFLDTNSILKLLKGNINE